MNKTTQLMTTALLHYLRFKKQSFVATEVEYGYGPADVLFIPKKEQKIYEVECKISKNDFLNEWKKKELKHKMLHTKINYFYFCVPKELSQFALEQINNKNLPYGLMVYEEKWVKYSNQSKMKLELSESIVILKHAQNLKKEENKFFNAIKESISLRAMSELASLYKEKSYLCTKSKDILKEITN